MIFLKGLGTSLAVQWLRIHASTAGARVRSLVTELRVHMPRGAAKKNGVYKHVKMNMFYTNSVLGKDRKKIYNTHRVR